LDSRTNSTASGRPAVYYFQKAYIWPQIPSSKFAVDFNTRYSVHGPETAYRQGRIAYAYCDTLNRNRIDSQRVWAGATN